jgi:hypothetical protein
MSSHHNFRPRQQNKLVSEPPIAAPDEHAQPADQRFRAALGQAIAAGGERIEAVEATVQLKRRLFHCQPSDKCVTTKYPSIISSSRVSVQSDCPLLHLAYT